VISQHRSGGDIERQGEFDSVAEQGLRQLGELRDGLVEGERLRLEWLALGEGEQLPCERGASLDRVTDGVEFFTGHAIRSDPVRCELDQSEQVVQVVSDPARQLSNGLHFLRLPEEQLEVALFAEVSQVAGEERAAGGLDLADRKLDGELAPVRSQAGQLESLPEDSPLPRRVEALHPVVMSVPQRRRDQELGHLLSQNLVARTAECPFRGEVELEDRAALVDRDDGVERGVEDRAAARLALAQLGLTALLPPSHSFTATNCAP